MTAVSLFPTTVNTYPVSIPLQVALPALTAVALAALFELVNASTPYNENSACGTKEECQGLCADYCWYQNHNLDDYLDCFENCFR